MAIELKNVLVIVNNRKETCTAAAKDVCRELDKRHVEYLAVEPSYFETASGQTLTEFPDKYRHRNYDLILAIGGDGTFLYTARTFADFEIPILGVNAGRLGFLMEVSPADFSQVMEGISKGNGHMRERALIEASILRGGKFAGRFRAANDVVISRGALSRMVETEVSVGGPGFSGGANYLSHYRADGIVVSTPVGSTAYNLSAGGPVLLPDTDAFVITPISPHTLGVRPVVAGADREIRLSTVSAHGSINLTIDGQENIVLEQADTVVLRRSRLRVKLYYLGDENFFHTLREKLGWRL